MERKERILYSLLAVFFAAGVLSTVIVQGPLETLQGFLRIQAHPARLINDFAIVGGQGGAVLNASIVALVGVILVRVFGITFSGPTFAAILTMFGFGLFGKTPLNIIPIIGGVYCASRIARRRFQEYILIALFGSALGPIASTFTIEIGLVLGWATSVSVIAGSVFAFLFGILLPPLALSIIHLHQGYNIYNMGFTCGFLGIFAASLMRAAGHPLPIDIVWNQQSSLYLALLPLSVSLSILFAGVLLGPQKAIGDFLRLQKTSGRLPSDFVDMVSLEGTLINIGVMGLMFSGLVAFIGAPFNGPVLGGIFTVMGFSAFGKHPGNVWPVVLGVILSSALFSQDFHAPSVILAILFCTTLAPIAGEFGPVAGIIAGFIHFFMVLETSSWHGGLNLYNNGLAGGLTATLMIAVIQWYRTNRTDT